MCFDTVPAAFNNMMGQKIYTFMMNFLKDSLSVSISSEMVWTEKLDCFHEGINFPNNVCHENRKKTISQL